jgi:hypothetical protein
VETKKKVEAPLLTRLVVDGVEIPVGDSQPALIEDLAMTPMFDALSALEEAENESYILSALSSQG